MRLFTRRAMIAGGWLAMTALSATLAMSMPRPAAAAEAVEKPDLKLAVGGKALLYYLPLTLTERLGYFKDAGLQVEIEDFAGGAKSLQAQIGGSVDVTVGSYEHTIQMQAEGKALVALIDLGRLPGIGLGIVKERALTFKSLKDLKGMRIGVTAPGSSTNFLVNIVLSQQGLTPEDVSIIGVGAGAQAVAAIRHGDLDAISNTDPVISELQSKGDIQVVVDARTVEGTRAVYGGLPPAAVLYAPPAFIQKYPKTTTALVTAFLRGLRWIQAHNADEIAAVMPEEYFLGNKPGYVLALKQSLQIYSPDGRFSPEAMAASLKIQASFDAKVKAATIDLSKTTDSTILDAVTAALKP